MRILGYIWYAYMWISFRVLLGYFYRYKVSKHSAGIENIPMDKPVIFCSNHPNSFMDAMMIGSSLSRRTWFLARSDAFRNKKLATFLTFIGIIPIYRLLEGAENLSKNDETFDKCSKMLEEKKAIIIFSEGLCITERRLRKLKKGTARIAFGSEDKNNFDLDLTIVPVGLNYSATPWKFRSTLFLNIGEPFALKQYEELYRTDKARAMNVFTRDLEQKMKSLIIHIDRKERDDVVDMLEEMVMEEWSEEMYVDADNQKETHEVTKKLVEVINRAEEKDEEQLNLLSSRVRSYKEGLKKLDIRDRLLNPKRAGEMGWGNVIVDFFYFTLLFPLWIFGVITNYIPYKIPSVVADKTTKTIEWHASVNGTLAVYLWQFYWLLQSLVVALVFRDWYILGAFMLAVPVCGYIAEKYWRRLKKSQGRSRLINAYRSNSDAIKELLQLRADIMNDIRSLKEQYGS